MSKVECRCGECVKLCTRFPGWGTPEEIQKIAFEKGLAGRLMIDWYEPDATLGNAARIFILAPASDGCAGDMAPEIDFVAAFLGDWKKGRCTFLADDNRCEIHADKPSQCRHGFGCGEPNPEYPRNIDIARAWDSVLGRALVSRWRQMMEAQS